MVIGVHEMETKTPMKEGVEMEKTNSDNIVVGEVIDISDVGQYHTYFTLSNSC